MGYLDVPFFNIGGTISIDQLAKLCKINKKSKVLVVGCGTGGNSCYLARKYQCQVVGIDIAGHMIQKAQRRAKELNLTHKVTFQLGDAYDLKFPSNSFDAVLTIFVSQFLDNNRTFLEFVRVLKNKGYLGINEMYKANKIPNKALGGVELGEQVFQELTGLPFKLNATSEWLDYFNNSCLLEITFEEYPNVNQGRANMEIIKEFGGWSKLFSTLKQMLILGIKSQKIRSKYSKISKGKRLLLQDRLSSKYIGYILVVGKKQ